MATNWSNSSGFGGGLGGSNLGRGNQSNGSSPWSNAPTQSGPWKNGVPNLQNPTAKPAPSGLSDAVAAEMQRQKMERSPNIYERGRGVARSWEDSAALSDSAFDTQGNRIGASAAHGGWALGDLLAGQYQPQRDDIGIQRTILDKRAGIDERGLGLRRGELTSNASFDRQRLGLKLQDLGIDRQGNALKLAGLGIDRKDNTSERGYITRLRELAGLSNTNASNRISFEGQDKARGIKSNYITGGTTFSPGHTYDQGANYLRTLNDLESQDLGYRKEVAGFDRRDEGLNLSDERIGLSEQEVGLANQKLDLMASNLGIDRAQLEDGLNRGLKQLGLEGEINALELISAQSRLTGEGAGLVGQMISDLYAHGLQPGDLMQGFAGNTLSVFG
jgi:hypothetical protein